MRPGKQHRCSGLYPLSLPEARKTTPLQRFISFLIARGQENITSLQRFISFLIAQGQENNTVAAVYILSHCPRPGKQHRCSGLYPFSLHEARKTTPLQRFISFLIARGQENITSLQRFISFLIAQGQENNTVAAVYILSHCPRPGKQHRCSGLYPFSLPKARKTTPLQRFISFLIARGQENITSLQRFISFLIAQGQENNTVAAVYILSHCPRPGKQHRCSGLYPFPLPEARQS